MPGEIVMCIGVPGSGKSTYLKSLYDAEFDPTTATYVSSDGIRKELLENVSDQSANHAVFSIFDDRVEAALKKNHIVYADATFTHGPLRREFLKKFTGVAKYITGIVVTTPLSDVFVFNNRRDAVVPHDVILRFYEKLTSDPPHIMEGFTELRAYKPDLSFIFGTGVDTWVPGD